MPSASAAMCGLAISPPRRRGATTALSSARAARSIRLRRRLCVRRLELMTTSSSSVLGVDVGGTFTDLLLYDAATKGFRVAKVPSQRGDEAVGFMQGIATVSGGQPIG